MSDIENNGRKRVTITLEERVHEMGKALAEAQRRDFSRCVETLIEAAFEQLKRAPATGHGGPNQEEAA